MSALEVDGRTAGILCHVLLVVDDFNYSGLLYIRLLLLYHVDGPGPFVSLFDVKRHLVTLGK